MSDYKLEEEFLNKLAEAYKTYDISPIKDLIADDFSYSSFWVWDELKGKETYLNYFAGKLETMKKSNVKNDFIIMYCEGDGKPVLMCSQKTEEGDRGVFVIDSSEIKKLNIMPASFYSLKPKDEKEYKEFIHKYN